jgi:hypothetical protein
LSVATFASSFIEILSTASSSCIPKEQLGYQRRGNPLRSANPLKAKGLNVNWKFPRET